MYIYKDTGQTNKKRFTYYSIALKLANFIYLAMIRLKILRKPGSYKALLAEKLVSVTVTGNEQLLLRAEVNPR